MVSLSNHRPSALRQAQGERKVLTAICKTRCQVRGFESGRSALEAALVQLLDQGLSAFDQILEHIANVEYLGDKPRARARISNARF